MISEELAQDETETGQSVNQTDKHWLWRKGQSGNPNGKPAGVRDQATLMREVLASLCRARGGAGAWLDNQRRRNPKGFLSLLQRLLPTSGSLTVTDERTFWHFLDELRAAQDERRRGELTGQARQLDATVLDPIPAGPATASVRSVVAQDRRSRPDPPQDTPGEDRGGKGPSTTPTSDNISSVTFDEPDENERKT